MLESVCRAVMAGVVRARVNSTEAWWVLAARPGRVGVCCWLCTSDTASIAAWEDGERDVPRHDGPRVRFTVQVRGYATAWVILLESESAVGST